MVKKPFAPRKYLAGDQVWLTKDMAQAMMAQAMMAQAMWSKTARMMLAVPFPGTQIKSLPTRAFFTL